MANYTIITNNESIHFKSKPLSFDTCLRIRKIMLADRMIKGYYIEGIEYSANGLAQLTVRKDDKPNFLADLLLDSHESYTEEIKIIPLHKN